MSNMKNEKQCVGSCSDSCPLCSSALQSQSTTVQFAADVKAVRDNISAALKRTPVQSIVFADLAIALAFLTRVEKYVINNPLADLRR